MKDVFVSTATVDSPSRVLSESSLVQYIFINKWRAKSSRVLLTS